MGEQYAMITGPDDNQVDRTLISDGIRTLESSGKISVSAVGRSKYKQQIISSFKAGAGNRSYCFFSFNNLKNAAPEASVRTYRIPVYGVRGTSAIGRAIGYACIYMSSAQDMDGLSFYSQVFDSYYLSEEEIRKLSNPLALTERGPALLPMRIHSDNKEKAMAVISQLYREQKADPDSRLLILLDDAEHGSMELLRDIYLLLPRTLRVNIGFATNITADAYKEMFGQAMLPIQLLTMDKKLYRDSAETVNRLDPALHVIDVSGNVSDKIDPTLRESLEAFISIERTEQSDQYFAYAEDQVISRNNNIPSMSFYPEIMRLYLDGSGFWWKSTDLDTIEALEGAYEGQKILMEDDQIRTEALSAFYLKMLPEKDYARQAAEVQLGMHKEKKWGEAAETDSSKSLSFLRQDLAYGKQIEAVDYVIKALDQDQADALKKQDERHSRETQELKKQQEIVLREKEATIRKLSDVNGNLEKEKNKLSKEAKNSQKELEQARRDLQKLKDDYDKDELNKKRRALQKANADLEGSAKRSKVASIVLGCLFGLTVAAAACAYLLLIRPELEHRNKEINTLNAQVESEQENAKVQISALESELEESKNEVASLDKQTASMESEKASLVEQVAALEEQIEQAKAAETASEVQGQNETQVDEKNLDGIYSNGYTDANGDFVDDFLTTPISPIDNDEDGYDDRTGWFIDTAKRDNRGTIQENGETVGPSRKTLDDSHNLISTIQDEYTKKMFELAQAGTIQFYDANGDWIDDRSGDPITRPTDGYHSETGWLNGWMDGDKDGRMDDEVQEAVCDYKIVLPLLSADKGSEQEDQENENPTDVPSETEDLTETNEVPGNSLESENTEQTENNTHVEQTGQTDGDGQRETDG